MYENIWKARMTEKKEYKFSQQQQQQPQYQRCVTFGFIVA